MGGVGAFILSPTDRNVHALHTDGSNLLNPVISSVYTVSAINKDFATPLSSYSNSFDCFDLSEIPSARIHYHPISSLLPP